MKLKSYGKIIFNIAVAIISVYLVLYFVVSENGLMDLINSNQKLNMFWFGGAIFFQLFNVLMDAVITYIFFHKRYPHLSFFNVIKIAMVGQFFCYITPASTGGQPMQIYYLSRMNVDVGYSTGAFLQKLLIWQVGCFIYGTSVFFFNFPLLEDTMKNPFIFLMVVAGIAAQIVIVVCILVCSFNVGFTKKVINVVYTFLGKFKIFNFITKKREGLEKQMDNFHTGSKELIQNPKLLIKAFICTMIQLTCIYIVPYCIYRSLLLNEESAVNMISLQAFVNLVSSMIPMPGATGAAEISFDRFFSTIFAGYIKSATIIWRIITYYGMVILTMPFVYVFNKKKKSALKSDIEETEVLPASESVINKAAEE